MLPDADCCAPAVAGDPVEPWLPLLVWFAEDWLEDCWPLELEALWLLLEDEEDEGDEGEVGVGNEGVDEDEDEDEADGDGNEDDEEDDDDEDEDDEDDDEDDAEGLEGNELELDDGLDCWVTQPDVRIKAATVNSWRLRLFMVFMSTFAPSIGFIRIRTSFCIRLWEPVRHFQSGERSGRC